MKHFLAYKELCILIGELNWKAIPVGVWREHMPLGNSQFYAVVRDLIAVGAIVRVKRGLYAPLDVYQWALPDLQNYDEIEVNYE